MSASRRSLVSSLLALLFGGVIVERQTRPQRSAQPFLGGGKHPTTMIQGAADHVYTADTKSNLEEPDHTPAVGVTSSGVYEWQDGWRRIDWSAFVKELEEGNVLDRLSSLESVVDGETNAIGDTDTDLTVGTQHFGSGYDEFYNSDTDLLEIHHNATGNLSQAIGPYGFLFGVSGVHTSDVTIRDSTKVVEVDTTDGSVTVELGQELESLTNFIAVKDVGGAASLYPIEITSETASVEGGASANINSDRGSVMMYFSDEAGGWQSMSTGSGL